MTRAIRAAAVLSALLCIAGAALAAPVTVTLRQDLDGYTGVSDTRWYSGPDAYGLGAAPTATIWYSWDEYNALLKFDLSGIKGDVGSVTSATLKLFATAPSATPFRVRQVGMDWEAGTQVDYVSVVDGAGPRFRFKPPVISGWTQEGATDTYSHAFSMALAEDQHFPGDATRRWLRSEGAYGTVYGGLIGYEVVAGDNTWGTAYADLASLQGAAIPAGNGDYGYFYDAGTDTLYVRTITGEAPHNAEGEGKYSLHYVDQDNTWDATVRFTAGGFDGTSDNFGSTLPDNGAALDVTALVQAWLGTDGQALAPNYGVEIADPSSYPAIYLSDEATQVTLRPTLEITYEPVPEPATLALLAVGGMAMLRRRRR